MDGGTDEEYIGKVVQFRLTDVGLFVDIAVESQIPALLGPIGVTSVKSLVQTNGNHRCPRSRYIQDLSRQGRYLAVVQAQTALYSCPRRKVLKEIGDTAGDVARDVGAQVSQYRADVPGEIAYDTSSFERLGRRPVRWRRSDAWDNGGGDWFSMTKIEG